MTFFSVTFLLITSRIRCVPPSGAKVSPDLRTSVIFFSTSSLKRSIRSDGSDRFIFSPLV